MSGPDENGIVRHGAGARWSDIVVYGGVARWVEVADDAAQDAAGQIRQVLAQIDATLNRLGSQRNRVLEVTIFLSNLADAPELNRQWDAWVIAGEAPIRACVGAQLSGGLRVEMIVSAVVAP